MEDWSWSSPSKIQKHPKPMRRMVRATGSGVESSGFDGNELRPSALSRRYCVLRTTFQPMAHTAPIRRTTSSWWKSAA